MVLNPPWSLQWSAERLGPLGQSRLPSVTAAFAAAGKAIDATLAAILIALDLLHDNGAALLIANEATLQRLVFEPQAPGNPIVKHIWRHDVFAGNPMTGREHGNYSPGWPVRRSDFQTGVIYFTPNHDLGPSENEAPASYSFASRSETTLEAWDALRSFAETQNGRRSAHNLSLRNGAIAVDLSLYDEAIVRVTPDLAEVAKRLNDLDGKNPLQVVMLRNERKFILGLLDPDRGLPWTVSPDLAAAVRAALDNYNRERSPLVPLPEIQRLGWLDEQDDILCRKDLFAPGSESDFPIFRVGARYPLSSLTVPVERMEWRANLAGVEEELELTGQELSLIVSSDRDVVFMEGRLQKPGVKIGGKPGDQYIDFTLQQLVDHFEIPEVPDLATLRRAEYQQRVAVLDALEAFFA